MLAPNTLIYIHTHTHTLAQTNLVKLPVDEWASNNKSDKPVTKWYAVVVVVIGIVAVQPFVCKLNSFYEVQYNEKKMSL